MTTDARARPPASLRWVFTMTVAFLYAAAVLRSLLAFGDGRRAAALVGLAIWLALLLTEPVLSRRWRPYFFVYVALQAAVIAVLLTLSDSSDFFGILLLVPSMQAMQRWPLRRAAALLTLFAVLTLLCLVSAYGPIQAVTFAAVYTGANIFLGAYALAAKHATEARLRNEALVIDLQEANRQLADYAARAERLAGARERQRLARDLHDSATQTLFSMTLTAQSALLLLERSPQQAADQLDRIDHLARSAVSEMGALGAELPLAPTADGGLAAVVQHHLEERARQDGLAASLEVDGGESLPPSDQAALLRIVREALNNVVKHAGTSQAVVRLRLRRPFRLEIEDDGAGFDAGRVDTRGLGLAGMRERAAEIGWSLTVNSSPGAGTRVVARELDEEPDERLDQKAGAESDEKLGEGGDDGV
jgi:signal transduction histidine kinase